MDRYSHIIIVILFCFALQPQKASGLTVEEIQKVRDIVKDLCQYPDRRGYIMKLQGTLEGGTIVRIVGIKGKATFSREEWEGVQDVLPEDRAPDREDVRSCAKQLTPLLLEKLEETTPETKYRPPQYYSGFGQYTLTPRDWVQLPYAKVEQADREPPMLGSSKWPPKGYCRIRFERERGGKNLITDCCEKGFCGGGNLSITHNGSTFNEFISAIISYKVVDADSMTVLVDIFQYHPKYLRRPDKVRPGDRFGGFEVGDIESGWANRDPPDKLRVQIGEGSRSSFLEEGGRYKGKKADVVVTKIGKDDFGHFAHVKLNYR